MRYHKYLIFSNAIFVFKVNRESSVQNGMNHIIVRYSEGKQWLVSRKIEIIIASHLRYHGYTNALANIQIKCQKL